MLAELEADISALTLVPSAGGVFEVDVDDQRIFSKKALGRHAEDDEVLTLIHQATP